MNYQAQSDKKGALKKAHRHEKGISFIEIILVISIIAILAGATSPFLSRFVTQVKFDDTVNSTIGAARKAQEYAMDGKNNAAWGICKTGTTLRLYSGTCNAPTSTNDYQLASSINMSGLSSITFNKRGEPSSAISIIIASDFEAKTIVINAGGGINVN